jgi:hypothetical protein
MTTPSRSGDALAARERQRRQQDRDDLEHLPAPAETLRFDSMPIDIAAACGLPWLLFAKLVTPPVGRLCATWAWVVSWSIAPIIVAATLSLSMPINGRTISAYPTLRTGLPARNAASGVPMCVRISTGKGRLSPRWAIADQMS